MDPLPDLPTPDQCAAHEFLADLRTRITTQPLPYQYGVEARALESLWAVFEQARAAMKKHPGSEKFADAATQKLNLVVRPITAKWHRAHEDGRLNSRDGADEFRGDLAGVQRQLQDFAEELHVMAYGSKFRDGLSAPAIAKPDLDQCFEEVPFGLPAGTRGLPDKIIQGINTAERADIAARRRHHGSAASAGRNAVGLALSGGGIRSATFSLGVVQVLADRGLLKDVDFLSTVSGGGYTGSFLTARLGAGGPDADVGGPHGPDPGPVQYLRYHAKFLNPVNLKDSWTMVTGTFAGMLLNWTAPLLVIVLAAIGATVFATYAGATFWPAAIKITGALAGFALILYGWLLRKEKTWRIRGGKFLGFTAALALAAGAAWLADRGFAAFDDWLWAGASRQQLGAAGLLAMLVTAGPAIIRFLPVLQKPAVRRIALQAALWLAGLIIPLLALFLFYLCRHVAEWPASNTAAWWAPHHYYGIELLATAAGVLALVAIFLLNVNLTAPHRLYRERLAKTFIQSTEGDDRPLPLAEINPSGRAPYHLINTTLNLPTSELPALRDRKCAFFLFSRHWTGSATIGYARTGDWRTNGAPVDLATAMAISGAAASSYMGLGSMPTLTALLTFLNVRLGFWIHRADKAGLRGAPGFSCLLREMVGWDMDENSRWLNLSDGGHIENMAVYELLRRRAKFILCVDGEADPAFNFEGLLTLVRHAQIDYGIRIEPDVKALRPDPATGCSQAHALFCRIHYPPTGDAPAAVGLLLYAKLSVTGNESELVHRYRTLHPEFPHESTADQFFNEEQFEAYRQLGVHVAEGLFSPALTGGQTHPPTFAAWYRRLAANLLMPEAPTGAVSP
ncbi:MAG TPA: hypothetical protein VG838_11440 [Opitutaceae bacterium]|nr:hypothetical protein [Opitutaceae bacterium]